MADSSTGCLAGDVGLAGVERAVRDGRIASPDFTALTPIDLPGHTSGEPYNACCELIRANQ